MDAKFPQPEVIIKAKYGGDAVAVGDEGGLPRPWIPASMALLMDAIEKSGFTDKGTVGLDVAASNSKSRAKTLTTSTSRRQRVQRRTLPSCFRGRACQFYREMIDGYPVVTIEDPFDQDDWSNWSKLCGEVGKDCQIVGDDLTVTNIEKIKEAVDKQSANCLLLRSIRLDPFQSPLRP